MPTEHLLLLTGFTALVALVTWAALILPVGDD